MNLNKMFCSEMPAPGTILNTWSAPQMNNMSFWAGVAEPGQFAYKGQIIGAGV
jgi:hypothetical protein